MGSPMSPIVANLYMKNMEVLGTELFQGTIPIHGLRYVDDTWVKITTQEVKAYLTRNNTLTTEEERNKFYNVVIPLKFRRIFPKLIIPVHF